MSDTTFSSGTTIASSWLNDVNRLTYDLPSTVVNKGASLVSMQSAGTVQQQLGSFVDAARYGALANGTDQTTGVQAALNSLGANGGLVRVTRGTKFNLQSLTFPIRSNIEYWMDDDLSRPNPITTLGTNESVKFFANANGSGIVNEYRVTGAFHPSWNIDLRRDVSGHDAFLGASQKRVPDASTPARMSWNMFDQQVDTYRTVFEIYGGAYSQFSGVTSHSWRRIVTVTGIGTGAGGWVSVPPVGTEITGNTSGAKGWFISADATTTTILWNSGKFAVGEKLIDNNETTVNTASGVSFSLTQNQPLGTDLRKGNWSVGLPTGLGDELLNLGGRLAVLPTRTFSQFVYKTITHPGIVLADLVADVPTNGYVLHYDTTAAAASRRPTFRKIASAVEGTQDLAHAASVRCFVQFTNSAIKSNSSFNCTSVTRTGTGLYTIAVPAGVFTTADFCVTFGTESPLSYAVCDWASTTTTSIAIKVYTTGTSTLADVIGRLSVTVVGGDI